jgi:hypothetical protein
MHLLIRCTCQQQLRAPQEAVGKAIRCPKCGAVVPVAAAAAPAPPAVAVPAPAPAAVTPAAPPPPPAAMPAPAPVAPTPAPPLAAPAPAVVPVAVRAEPPEPPAFALQDANGDEGVEDFALPEPRPRPRHKRGTSGWVWLVVAGCVAATAGIAIGGTLLIMHFIRAGQEDLSTWKEFKCADGRFRVTMPEIPPLQKQTLNTPLGPVALYMYMHENRRYDYSFAIAYCDYPANLLQASAKAGLDGARDGILANTQGAKLQKETPIALSGHPGRDLTVDVAGKAKMRIKLYLVKNRLYQLVVVQSGARPSAEAVAKFFDSFRLDEAPTTEKDKRSPKGAKDPKSQLHK